MSKKNKTLPPPPNVATISPELALKLLAILEVLAEHDTYQHEYDCQMMTECHSCGWLEKGHHYAECDFIKAKELIAQAYAPSDDAKLNHVINVPLVRRAEHPTGDQLRKIAAGAKNASGPSDSIMSTQYVLAGWMAALDAHDVVQIEQSSCLQPVGWLHTTLMFESYWEAHMDDSWKPVYAHPPIAPPLTTKGK